jgi:predicted NBD/HSP70 family sugar kinase
VTATLKKYHQLKREVFRDLYLNKVLTLTELSKLTHKSLPIVTTIVNDLIDEGYVLESGQAPSTGGRRPSMYHLNNAKEKYIVAVAMDQLATKVVIYDLANNVQFPAEEIRFPLLDQQSTIAKLVTFLNDYIQRSGIDKKQLLGIGLGMPGFINLEEGRNHSFLKPEGDLSLTDTLKQKIGIPVFIDNDSSLLALAELRFGAGKNAKEVLVINIGWGVGLGMIINGRLFRGHSGYAGEFSHIPLSLGNKLCSCGKRGCLEVDTSLLVLVDRAKAEIAKGVSSKLVSLFDDESKLPGEHFINAANEGDPLAVSVLSDGAFLIGKGIATLIHIMNPEIIVLGGRGAGAGKILMAPVAQAINEFCIPRLAEQSMIVTSELKHEASLLGAAILVVENCQFT